MERMITISIFEHEFGRILSPIEVEIIDDWFNEGFTKEQMRDALKESVYNGKLSFKYISKILQSWKAIDEAADTLVGKEEDFNWLE